MNTDLYENARWLIGAIARGLNLRPGEGVRTVLERMAEQALGKTDFHQPDPSTLPVLRHLPQCIGEVMLFDPDLAAAIAAVEEDLRWLQPPAESGSLLGEGFHAGYGWTEIIGPHGFFPGDDFLLGLLMLGPGHHVRNHFHPAPELHWPLTSGSQWSRNREVFAEQPQGAMIWHPPMTVHATRTMETPLLAVWSWTRETMTPAELA